MSWSSSCFVPVITAWLLYCKLNISSKGEIKWIAGLYKRQITKYTSTNLNFLGDEWVGKSQQWQTTANTTACQKSHMIHVGPNGVCEKNTIVTFFLYSSANINHYYDLLLISQWKNNLLI